MPTVNFVHLTFLSIFICFVSSLSFAQTGNTEMPTVIVQTAEPVAQEEGAPVPASEITLEANLVQIVLNDEHRQGVDWEAIVSDFHTLQLKKEDNPIWAEKKYRISIGTVSSEDYAVLLDALDTVGKMTQVSQDPAVLEPGTKQSLSFSLADANATGIRVDATLNSDAKAGLQLHLEPFIGIILKDAGRSTAVTLKAQTDMALKENTAIVIGGIIAEQEINKTHKFPLLGDLPLLGMVFRSHGKLMQKIETVVFLTPRFKAGSDDKEK